MNPAFPDAPLKLFGAGADSGTFDYFTEAVTGKSKSSRGDFTASEDDNVLVQGVSQDVNALAFFGYAYYAENTSRLKAVPIAEKGGKPAVMPSEKSVLDGTYQPLSRPIFIYVNAKSLAKPEVKEFVEYYMKEGAKMAKEVKYVPLPVQGVHDQSRAPGQGQEGHRVRRCVRGRHHDRGAAGARSQALTGAASTAVTRRVGCGLLLPARPSCCHRPRRVRPEGS